MPQRENTLRGTGVSAGNARKTHCKRGHPLGGDNLRMDGSRRDCKACRNARQRAFWSDNIEFCRSRQRAYQAAHPDKVRLWKNGQVILVDCKQGSSEWLRARMGIPTASNFSRILTPTGKPSTQAERYMRKLLAEHFVGEPADGQGSQFMQRGTLMEQSARAWYAFKHDIEPRQVGVCLRDDRMVGASPDALVGESGTLELKCPSAPVQIKYLLGGLEGEYFSQVQGQLYVTDREWCDLVAYNPALPPVVTRIMRDDDYIGKLASALDVFVEHMLAARERLIAKGCKPAEKLLIPASMVMEDPW